MNAAFLLMTTAWLTGADPAPAANQPAPAPVVSSAPYGGGGGCGCNGGCGDACGESGCHGGLLGRLRGRFHHGGDCGCETNTCDTCGGHHFGKHFRGHEECGCETNTCGCERQRLCDRLRGLFHRGECGCGDTCGCGDNGCAGATTYAAPGVAPRAEPIPAPKGTEPAKKMPTETPMKRVGALTPQASPTLIIEQ